MLKDTKRNQKIASKSTSSTVKRRIPVNIGTIIFGAIFIYIVASLILYMTANHVVSYQVTGGPLAKNQEYSALVLRNETVVTTDSAGYLTYYAPENEKVRKTGSVYGIGQEMPAVESLPLTDETYRALQSTMENFTGSFNGVNFSEVYNCKYKLHGEILSANMNAGTGAMGAQTIMTAPEAGIVVYAIDGYEDYDVSHITSEQLDRKTYMKTDLKTSDRVKEGSAVYKLITSDRWSVVIPLSSRQIVDLDGRTQIRVRFLKDNTTQVGSLTIVTGDDGAYYGIITFANGMIRYVNDRFLDIELVTNTQTGLKIPISSIITKSFYVIPEDFAVTGGDSNSLGFLRLTQDEEGTARAVFVSDTLYEHKDGCYYVDSDEFDAGDILVKGGTTGERFIVGETRLLEGVYSINKGYAVFRKIVIIDKNEDYAIVEKGTTYGIAQFDYIVLDAADVKESEITVN